MKPIEIHIEGYKIVISEDKETQEADKVGEAGGDEKQKIIYAPCPLKERPHVGDWWTYPNATWSNDVVLTVDNKSKNPVQAL